jgi:hypothetical protein
VQLSRIDGFGIGLPPMRQFSQSSFVVHFKPNMQWKAQPSLSKISTYRFYAHVDI